MYYRYLSLLNTSPYVPILPMFNTHQELVQTNVDEAKENLKKIEEEMKSHPHVTTDQFEQYAKTCVSTALSYFLEKFER